MEESYPRNMVGYGGAPPHANWPRDARIAVQFVVNYEEGGENNVLHGDPASEAFLSESPGARPIPGARNLNVESDYEYGSRAGFWRLHAAFRDRSIPVTAFGVAMALDRNPEAVGAMRDAEWEIASHGYRWIDYQHVPVDLERAHLKQALEIHEQVVGSRPLGWYTGRVSPNTRRLVVEEGGFLYDSDAYSDDLPFWVLEHGAPHLVVPYSLDNNDMRFSARPGFATGREFTSYLVDAFDTLYAEGQTRPKMMSIGLHCRIAGRPGRTAGLLRFLDHVQAHDDVWICRRVDIARHWHENHRPPEHS